MTEPVAASASGPAPAVNIEVGFIVNTEPATGRPMPKVKVATKAEVAAAVQRAREVQPSWAALGRHERTRILLRLRDIINDHAEELARLVVQETGKPYYEALAHDVVNAIDLTHYVATRSGKLLRDESLWLHLFWPMRRAYLRYVPRGVIGVISPWDFPLALPVGDVVMALAAGNGVVVKPSEWTPHTAARLQELAEQAGVPRGLFGVIQGAGATGAELCRADVNMVVFTGGPVAGQQVGRACGERLIPYVAELGGKDVAIVLEDVDIERAARQVVHGAFANAGQACASFERLLVHNSIAQPFSRAVVEHTKALRVGDPMGEVDVGAITRPAQFDIIADHVERSRAMGATIACGGEALPGPGRFYKPTILLDVTSDMPCWREETFGPTLPIRTFSTDREAIALANDTEFGLNGYVFSSSVPRAESIARDLEVGSVVVNDWFVHHGMPETPWGGMKRSGVGRIHGKQALRELCEVQHINLPRFPNPQFFGFPYDEKRRWFVDKALRKLLRGPLSRFV